MSQGFSRAELVRFQHCDPAGIVFYPRYVEMVNATIEDWFGAVIGISFAEIHTTRETAIPARALEFDFRQPSRIGECLDFTVAIRKLGNSSITLGIHCHCAQELRFIAGVTLVHVPKSSFRPAPWPEDFRAGFNASLELAAS